MNTAARFETSVTLQFLVTGHDGSDDKALERRLAAREAHLSGADKLRQSGNLLFASAILNDSGKMIGSSLVMDFDSRASLDAWLNSEPYVIQKVWERVEIFQCKVAPGFGKASI